MSNNKEENKKYLDKIRGCLIGGAAGDALGYPIEFFSWQKIREYFGSNGIEEYQIDKQTGRALISDDTQMTLFTANGILYGCTRGCLRGIMAPIEDYIHMAYLDWLVTQTKTQREYSEKFDKPGGISWLLDVPQLYENRAPGNSCLSALKSGKKGNIDEPINNSKGCGGIMRAAPVALCSNMLQKTKVPDIYRLNMQKLDMHGAKTAAITHGHSLGYMPAAVLVHIIHCAVYKNEGCDMDLDDIVEEGIQAAAVLFAYDENLAVLTSIMDKARNFSKNSRSDEKIENLQKNIDELNYYYQVARLDNDSTTM